MSELPDIPFREGTIPYQVMLGSLQGGEEGGWADLTTREIAEVLCTTQTSVDMAIKRIKKKTGYVVPHANGYKKRYSDGYDEW